MRVVWSGVILTFVAGTASAQGSWSPQASPSPAPPPPVYVAPPAPPPPPTAVGKSRPARPEGYPGGWVTNNDYPTDAMRSGIQGTTGFRLTISPAGAVSACDITLSSGSPSLDATACRLMTERGRFSPALDAKGKPTTGTWSSRFRWVLPDDAPVKVPDAFADTLSFVVEADGSATGCTGTGRSAEFSLTGPCGKGVVFAPFLDAAGKPVRRKVTLMSSLSITDPGPAPAVMPTTVPRPPVVPVAPPRPVPLSAPNPPRP